MPLQGMSAKNEAKTHCMRDHPFDEKNTRWSMGRHGRKIRHCKVCENSNFYRKCRCGSNQCIKCRILTPTEIKGIAKWGIRVPEIVNPLRKGMESPQECRKCRAIGVHNFFHDFTDGMESYRCRQCGTEHYAYDAPPKTYSNRGKYSS